jgi:hypothetical protein
MLKQYSKVLDLKSSQLDDIKCRVCGVDIGELGNICVPCGAKRDAYIYHRSNEGRRMNRGWYIGDLSSLTQDERTQYMRAFDYEAARLQGQVERDKKLESAGS